MLLTKVCRIERTFLTIECNLFFCIYRWRLFSTYIISLFDHFLFSILLLIIPVVCNYKTLLSNYLSTPFFLECCLLLTTHSRNNRVCIKLVLSFTRIDVSRLTAASNSHQFSTILLLSLLHPFFGSLSISNYETKVDSKSNHSNHWWSKWNRRRFGKEIGNRLWCNRLHFRRKRSKRIVKISFIRCEINVKNSSFPDWWHQNGKRYLCTKWSCTLLQMQCGKCRRIAQMFGRNRCKYRSVIA